MDANLVVGQMGKEVLDVADAHASDVDRCARFPVETVQALRKSGALGAAVPSGLGGAGDSLSQLSASCTALGRRCASSAMILAMHHIQVLSIARHLAGSKELGQYLESVASEQRLIASATSEVGPGGDLRTSVAAVEPTPEGFRLTKKATTVSYGAHADDLLISARRDPHSAPNDQSLVLALQGDYEMRDPGNWDTLGMRGTCSPGAVIHATGAPWQVVPVAFGEIATSTMVPASHILWAAVWLGIASDAVAKAQEVVRAKARSNPGSTPAAAVHLSKVMADLHCFRDGLAAVTSEYEALAEAEDLRTLSSLSFALRINNLKLMASTKVVEITSAALSICGIAGYKNDGPYSLGRHLRDSHSAALMIHNDRLHETNASLLLIHKGQ